MYGELKTMNAELKKELEKARAETEKAKQQTACASSDEEGGGEDSSGYESHEEGGEESSSADGSAPPTAPKRMPSAAAHKLAKEVGLQSGCVSVPATKFQGGKGKPSAKRRWEDRVKQQLSCVVKRRCDDSDSARLVAKAL
eukprot:5389962-Pleurochrysis_carterae.AAC.1